MSNTDHAQEPTMEEILASIRRIISDEGDAAASDEPADSVQEDPVGPDLEKDLLDQEDVPEIGSMRADEAGDAEVPSNADADDDILELTDVVADIAPAFEEPAQDADFLERAESAGDVEFVDTPEIASDKPSAEPVPEPATAKTTNERIMSEVTDSAVAAAFGELASTLLSRDGNTRTLEELVQEMLRPMLKSWLDENLPGIAEDLVRQEIERAARRGGR